MTPPAPLPQHPPHPRTPPHPPCQSWLVVLWILGFADVVWEDSGTFLPKPWEQEQGCLGPFLSLGLLSKDFWLDGEIVACGQ